MTVTVEVPVAAVLLAASVSVLVPVVLVGLNVAVTPLGTPEAARPTLPVKPFSGATVMVLVPLAPCVMVRLLGNAERLKFGAGGGAAGVSVTDDWYMPFPEVNEVGLSASPVRKKVTLPALVAGGVQSKFHVADPVVPA